MQNPCVDEFEAYASYLAETELHAYTYDYVYDWNDAADVVREALTVAASRRDEFDTRTGPDGLRNWLRAICRKLSKTYVPFACWEESPVFGDQAYCADHHGELEHWRQDERYRAAKMMRFFGKGELTPPQRECFYGDITGESQTEIARRLGIKVQTVSQHIYYAKKKLNPKNPDLIKRKRPSPRQHPEAERSRRFMDELLNNIVAEQFDQAA